MRPAGTAQRGREDRSPDGPLAHNPLPPSLRVRHARGGLPNPIPGPAADESVSGPLVSHSRSVAESRGDDTGWRPPVKPRTDPITPFRPDFLGVFDDRA
jgi:hypothetical protein